MAQGGDDLLLAAELQLAAEGGSLLLLLLLNLGKNENDFIKILCREIIVSKLCLVCCGSVGVANWKGSRLRSGGGGNGRRPEKFKNREKYTTGDITSSFSE